MEELKSFTNLTDIFLKTEYVRLCWVLEQFPAWRSLQSAGDVDQGTGIRIHLRSPVQKLSARCRGRLTNSVLAWSLGCQSG